VVPSQVVGKPLLSVAELIASRHNVPTIQHFLQSFRYAEGLLFGHSNIRTPMQIVSEQGKAILLACLQEFNKETVLTFLERAWRIVNHKANAKDITLMTPHICCSHLMHNASDNCKKISKNNSKRLYSFLLYSMSLLVNSYTFSEFQKILEDVSLLVLTSHNCPKVQKAYTRIQQRIEKLNKDDFQLEHDCKCGDVCSAIEKSFTKSDPRGPCAERLFAITDSMQECSSTLTTGKDENRCYSPEFMECLKRLLPIAPLWSNFLLYKMSNSKTITTTQGTIENYMKLMKTDDFNGKHHLCVDEVASLQKNFIQARCCMYGDAIQKRPYSI